MKAFFKAVAAPALLLLLLPGGVRAQSGDALFNDTSIHAIYLSFSQPNYWSLLSSGKTYDDANDTATYIAASVTIDGTAMDSVGVQFKGNSSYYNVPGNKKPFTLAFDEYVDTQRYDGLKSINLNNGYQDPTLLKEKMFLDFCNEVGGINAPRANYAKLYINGSYYGLYLMVERVAKKFCKERFGNGDGTLYKGDTPAPSCANLKYHGTMSSYYNCYDLKLNDSANNWTDLVALTRKINQSTDAQFYDSVSSALNITSFVRAWAACNLLVSFDSYPFRFKHNYYLYHNTATDRFEWIVWDASTAFGADIPLSISDIKNTSVLYLTSPVTDAPLTKRMLADSAARAAYFQAICSLTNYRSAAEWSNRVDVLANRIRPAMYADPNKPYSTTQFDDNLSMDVNIGSDVPGLKPLIAARLTRVLGEMDSLGVNCSAVGTGIVAVHAAPVFSVSPNPSLSAARVVLAGSELAEIHVRDVLGRVWFSGVITNELVLDTQHWPRGIFTITLSRKGVQTVRRLVVR